MSAFFGNGSLGVGSRFKEAELATKQDRETERLTREKRRRGMSGPQRLYADFKDYLPPFLSGILADPISNQAALRSVVSRRGGLLTGGGLLAFAILGAGAANVEAVVSFFQEEEPTRSARRDLRGMHQTFSHYLSDAAYSGQFEGLSTKSADEMLALLNQRDFKYNTRGVVLEGLRLNDPGRVWAMSDFPKDNTESQVRIQNIISRLTASQGRRFNNEQQIGLVRELVRIPQGTNISTFQPNEDEARVSAPNKHAAFLGVGEGYIPPEQRRPLPVLHAKANFPDSSRGGWVTAVTDTYGGLRVSIEYQSPEKKIIY